MIKVLQHRLHRFENRRFWIDEKNFRLIRFRWQFAGFLGLCRRNFLARNFDGE